MASSCFFRTPLILTREKAVKARPSPRNTECPLRVKSRHLHCTSPCPNATQPALNADQVQCPLWVKRRHVLPQKVMSTLPPKADICSALAHVCYGPIADTQLSRGGGQGELKYCAARFIGLCPQPAPMGVDDRPANRQPHPHAAGLRGVKCIEHALEMRRIEARPGIAYYHKDACAILLGADQ
jgi:hypothetical protein